MKLEKVLVITLATLTLLMGQGLAQQDGATYDPRIDTTNFVNATDIGKTVEPNPFYPLVPGHTRVYKKGVATITFKVIEFTKLIEGVTCAVVHDVVEENGTITEDTYDWYAQDKEGNVWYFGEATQKFADGVVSTEGSWTAGVDNAKPGVIMWAKPEAKVGEIYRQEYYAGHAEDISKVLSLTESATTTATSCEGNCLLTEDTTPLEPAVLEHKFYAPGIGFIYEDKINTGEKVELIEFSTKE
jgi:hypothetical protein